MKVVRTLALTILLCATSSIVRAGIQPSFRAEVCSWRATDIVVVTEGEKIDGVFKIIETLKGDLKPGQTIQIPEMAEFKTREAREINDWDVQQQRGLKVSVTGEKMILFLRDADKLKTQQDEDDDEEELRADANASRWRTANLMGSEIKYSTVWIEKDKVYWFIQEMNPGPSLLSSAGIKTTALRNVITDVVSVQTGLKNAVAVTDLARKAESLKPFVRSSIYLAREIAFRELASCGQEALPVLRTLLNDESLGSVHADVIDSMEAAGGKGIGPELTLLLDREIQFWRQTAAELRPGWWYGKDFELHEAMRPFRNRWEKLRRVLLALQDIRFAGCEKTVAEFNVLIRSLPQLYDHELGRVCDEILRALGGKKNQLKEMRLPLYEVSFTGNRVFTTAVLEAKFEEYVVEYQHLHEPQSENMFHYAVSQLGKFVASQGYAVAGLGTSYGTNERGVSVSVDISEGRRFRLGSITVEGARALSPENIRAMLDLRSGDIVDFAAVNSWLSVDLRRSYNNLGFLDYSADREQKIRAEPNGSDPGIMDFKITIDEGPRVRVQSIGFEGKSDVSEANLRRVLRIAEGDIYSQEKFEESIEAINKLGLDLNKANDVHLDFDESRTQVRLVFILDKRTSRLNSPGNQLGRRVRRIFNFN